MQAIYLGETKTDLVNGETYNPIFAKFSGRKYKPGKDLNGWLDKEGEPDNRFMMYGSSVPYKVYESASDALKEWKPANTNDSTYLLLKKFSNG